MQLQNKMSILDSLYCEENKLEWEDSEGKEIKRPFPLSEADLFWEDDELETLLSNIKRKRVLWFWWYILRRVI